MPERNWTPAQRRAIGLSGGSLLVSAAAGSGKTAVLVERILRKITDRGSPCDVDRLLVVTFTNAAASEMKERVGRRLGELIARDPRDDNLARQQMLLQSAHISTIHSFCLELIREHFQTLGLSPDFRIADENEIGMLRGDLLEEILEEQYALGMEQQARGEEAPFLGLAETLGSGRDDGRLTETVLRLYEFTRSLPDTDQWLAQKLAMYAFTGDAGSCAWGAAALRYISESLHGAQSALAGALERMHTDERIVKAYGDAYGQDLAFVEKAAGLAHEGRWDALYGLVSGYEYPRLGPLRKFEDEALKNSVKEARDRAKKIVAGLREGMLSCNSAQLAEDLSRMRPMVQCLFAVVQELDRRLFEQKKARSLLDFGDLEQLALRLLTRKTPGGTEPAPEALEISRRFDEILIDEYQDVNPAQDAIFAAVSQNGRNLFLVGDVKQSIYRFRQAMPELFLAKKESYALCEGPQARFPAKIILGSNFRSRPGVTGAVNFIFRQLMSKELGEIEYDSSEELLAAADYPAGEQPEFELHLIDTTEYEGTEDGDTLEARHIAGTILSMMRGGAAVTAGGAMRPVRWSDFCILLRSASGRVETYLRELALWGIPVWAEVPNGYLNSYEVAVMLSLLRVLDNPLQDVPLLSVMLSPMFGFLPDDLAQLRIQGRQGPLYLALAAQTRSEEGGRFAGFVETLDRLRRVGVLLPVDRLILRIYDETGFLYLCEAMPAGKKRLSNLRLLLDYARNYETAGYKGLAGFVRFVDRVSETRGDFAPASAASEGADVVRVMSIHKSKGLEFPFCIVADCSKPFNLQDVRQNAMFSPSCGFGCMLRDEKLGFRYTTLPREAVKDDSIRSTLSEEMRVLYVAMTRAKEKLILTGTLSKPENAVRKAAGLLRGPGLDPFKAAESRSFLEWVLACALRHPDAGVLRSLAGMDEGQVIDDPVSWRVMITEPELSLGEDHKEGAEAAQTRDETRRWEQIISQRLTWRYPYAALARIPSKISVTDVVKADERLPAASLRPSFLQGQKLTGARAGTALHGFLQYADFGRLSDADGVHGEIQRLVEAAFLLPEEGEAVPADKVERFARSALFARATGAEKLWREFRFTAEMPAAELVDGASDFPEESVVLQGMADLVFLEGGGAVIADYKTDHASSREELVQKYSRQLDLYARAISSILDVPVLQKHIYSFHLDCDILL